jgi:hypothetical protein
LANSVRRQELLVSGPSFTRAFAMASNPGTEVTMLVAKITRKMLPLRDWVSST